MTNPPVKNYIRKMGEFFVNTDIIHDVEQQYRTRILASCLIVFTLYSAIVASILLIQYLHGEVQATGFIITTFLGLFYSVCLLILKKTGKNLLIAHAFAIPLYGGLLTSCFLSGGANASSNQIFLVIPLILFFTAGASSGFVWAGIALTTQTVIFIMDLQGFDFQQTMNNHAQIQQGFLHWVVTLSGIIGIALVYEKAHQNLIMQRDKRETDNRFLSTHDLLTNVINRHAVEKILSQHLRITHKHKQTLTLLIVDISKFHYINSRYGYTVGDNILLILADRLKSLPDIKIVARTNGNQFLLATRGHNHDLNQEKLLHDILQLASLPFTVGHQIVSLNITIGIAEFSNGMMTTDELMLEAEHSLREAKQQNLAYLAS